MIKDRLVQQLKGKKRENFRFGVFDIETEGLGGDFIIGGIYDPVNGYRTHDSMLSLVQDIFSHPELEWWTHNGCRYDYTYFLLEDVKNWILDHDWNVRFMMTKTQAVGLTAEKDSPKKTTIKLKDFFRFIPQGLDKITKTFGVQHQKLKQSIDFETETFRPDNPVHLQYLEHDVLGLYESIEAFADILWTHFHVVPGWTGPGTAMTAWRRTIPKGKAYYKLSPQKREFFRRCYFGGMVQARYAELPEVGWGVTREDMRIESYDVNSMYPAQMLEGVPVGNPSRTFHYEPGKPGFYHVRVQVPDDSFPMIPYRSDTGTQWPVGEFETYCSSREIEFAEQQGYRFEIIEGYVFPDHEKIFDDFLNICRTIRKDHKGTPLELCAKLMQNSLYGKFGSGEETQTIYLSRNRPETEKRVTEYCDKITGELLDDIYLTQEPVDAPYLQPHWAAWITAGARVTLSTAAVLAGNRFVYCDTDSLRYVSNGLEEPLIQEDPVEYGRWKHEGTIREWYCSGPKTYAARTTDDQWYVRNKGLPSRVVQAHHIRRSVQGEKVSIPMRTLSSLPCLLKNNQDGPECRSIERTVTQPTTVQGFQFDQKTKMFFPLKIFS